MKNILRLYLIGFIVLGTIFTLDFTSLYAQSDEDNNNNGNDNEIQRIIGKSQSGLNITSATSYAQGDYFYIVGEVLNMAQSDKEFVKVVATLYDNNHNVIGTEFTYTEPTTISSQESAPFKLIVSNSGVSSINSIKSYKIVASSN